MGFLVVVIGPALSGPAHAQSAGKSIFSEEPAVETGWAAQIDFVRHSATRLPLAALLSAMLAFRPRRRGTPKRQAPVIQTQIILALVGAIVMLVVGASLARAFGIVGAAGLIRYRAKVDDPKDAGVMLSTLAIGLAAGVGLYLFAICAAVFVVLMLMAVESIDPTPYLLFDLAITADSPKGLKKKAIQRLLRRHEIPYELSSTSDKKLTYEVKLPPELHTDVLSQALVKLVPKENIDVKWEHRTEAKTS